jgi:ABC-type multidrug transport system fused ATPase/permease subunit
MPSVNRILGSYNNILFSYKSLEIIHNDLMYDSENLGSQKILFKNKIEINQICFEYEKNKPILNKVNLIINKNSKIAFIGESGSGKSTLVDLIIGLYKPYQGTIKIDGVELDDDNIKNWRSKVGYIPQSVYLFDGTVEDNILFGNKYDKSKIIKCLKEAQIYDFLEQKDGLKTFVGEGGIMLSGGQKQRIAIARALYTDPEILILDEATSALDDDTEGKIMEEIYELSQNKTLIIVAHRLSTIKKCDMIYKIMDGKIINE